MKQIDNTCFDFVVFENWHLAYNHYKDVGLIADLLFSSGYSVAIADVYPGLKDIHVENIPHIKINHTCKLLKYHDNRTKTFGFLRKVTSFINQTREAHHLKEVMSELEGRYRHLYCGSYYVKMPTGWINMIPDSSNAFFWGLRSSRLVQYQSKEKNIRTIFSYRLAHLFEKRVNLKFFVSDELILSEFLDLGIAADRLVVRPERFIEDYSEAKDLSSNVFSLLSIGSLRPEKRIESIIHAVKEINDADIRYTIAGRAKLEYESVIEKEIGVNSPNIKRLNYRLTEEEFNDLIVNSDFLILCDEQQTSNVTNGTMNEALLSGVPIIAPNYAPYNYFIKHYKIGLLFNPDNIDSLIDAIHEAKFKGRLSFQDAIHRYQSLYLKRNVVKQFADSLQRVINDSK